MNKITPCLWFDDQAEEAAKFYTSVFQNSKVTGVTGIRMKDMKSTEKKPDRY